MELSIWIWGALVVLFLAVEFITDKLIAIWFTIGSIIGLILAIIGVPIWIQIVSCNVCGFVLLCITKKIKIKKQ